MVSFGAWNQLYLVKDIQDRILIFLGPIKALDDEVREFLKSISRKIGRLLKNERKFFEMLEVYERLYM